VYIKFSVILDPNPRQIILCCTYSMMSIFLFRFDYRRTLKSYAWRSMPSPDLNLHDAIFDTHAPVSRKCLRHGDAMIDDAPVIYALEDL
jgi:hypothetical protein